jgi:hypothetical protein
MLPGLFFGLALAASAIWILVASLYVDGRIGWSNLIGLHPSELASLLAGVFAPLAVLWLVLAYLRQGSAQRELAQALRILHKQSMKSLEQTETFSRALTTLESRNQHDSSFAVAEKATGELAALAAEIAVAFERLNASEVPSRWRMAEAGDRWSLFRPLIESMESPEVAAVELASLLAGRPHLRRPIAEYLQLHERISDFLRKNEIAPLVRDAFDDGPPGRLYTLLLATLRHDPVATSPAPPPAGGSNPAAARLASRVAKVLLPEGESFAANDEPSLPLEPSPAAAKAPEPPPAPPPAAPRPASPQPALAAQPGRPSPFSPLSPEFPQEYPRSAPDSDDRD